MPPRKAARMATMRHSSTKQRRPEPSPARGHQDPTTREHIVYTSALQFAERGYRGASLTDVVADLGLTKGAFYYYFADKDALATEIVDRYTGLFEKALAGADGEAELDTLVRQTHELAYLYRSEVVARAGARLLAEQASADFPTPLKSWIDHASRLLRTAKRHGRVSAEVDPLRLAQMIVSSFEGIRLMWESAPGAFDLRAQIDVLWQLLLPQLRGDA